MSHTSTHWPSREGITSCGQKWRGCCSDPTFEVSGAPTSFEGLCHHHSNSTCMIQEKMEWKAAHSTCQVQSELFGAHLSAEIRLISELQMGGINRRVINRTSKNFIAK